jgi:small-conductance mechanosensitive channel
MQDWSNVLTDSFQDLWQGIIAFLPNLVIAILIFIVGWIVGALIGRLVAQLVRAVKVDGALRSAGVEDAVRRAGFKLDSGAFLGALVKWFILVVFLVAALDVLRLHQVNEFLREVVLIYLPQVIVAVLILLVAAIIAEAVQNLVVGSAKAAHVGHAHFLGAISKWSIWIFAILAALYQLGIAPVFLQTLFTGIVVAASLAVGLSFGLGGQDAAKRFLENLRNDMFGGRQ